MTEFVRGSAAITPSVCPSASRWWDRMQLTPFCLVMSCLQVIPDRSQFFQYDVITLSCGDLLNSTGWKVKRKTWDGGVRPCTSGWGTASSGSTCLIGDTYPTDTGVYWCESADGNRSNSINITIADSGVLLKSPALPVSLGAPVTLHCEAATYSSEHMYVFRKDGRLIGNSSTGEMTIDGASKSDEGLYTCEIPGFGKSVGSWLNVEGPLVLSSPAPAASCSHSVSRLMCHLLVGIPYVLSTVLLGLIYRDRCREARPVAQRRGSNDIIMEILV